MGRGQARRRSSPGRSRRAAGPACMSLYGRVRAVHSSPKCWRHLVRIPRQRFRPCSAPTYRRCVARYSKETRRSSGACTNQTCSRAGLARTACSSVCARLAGDRFPVRGRGNRARP
jgi:hypothetical protein